MKLHAIRISNDHVVEKIQRDIMPVNKFILHTQNYCSTESATPLMPKKVSLHNADSDKLGISYVHVTQLEQKVKMNTLKVK